MESVTPYPDLVELLEAANRIDDLAASWQLSRAAKAHLSNAAYLIRLAVEREDDRRS